VDLPEPLVEELLSLGPRAHDREFNPASALDANGGLARTFVEGFALVRMSGLELALLGGLLFFFGKEETRGGEEDR
jgi:hypothetical protein